MNRLRSVALAALLLLAAAPRAALAVCAPFPCVSCNLTSAGQLNLVIFDRGAGQVRMIPNIRIRGLSEDFALLVPTPGLPSLEATNNLIWQDAELLTQPTYWTGSSASGCGCSEVSTDRAYLATGDGVIVHDVVRVGHMLATILSSDDPDTLFTWLEVNDYRIRDEDRSRLAPYVAAGWFFTAMRPDPTDPRNEMPAGGWNDSVNPVVFTWAATRFDLPLPILDINRGGALPVVLYVVDDHRADAAGFLTSYANDISGAEYRAIRERYPLLARYLGQGRWFTRMTRTFLDGEDMSQNLPLTAAPKDEEYRSSWASGRGIMAADFWLLACAGMGVRGFAAWAARRRRRQSDAVSSAR